MLVAARPVTLRELVTVLEDRLTEKLAAEGALRLVGDASTEITGLTEDSRRVEGGALFVARRGTRGDGLEHLPLARERGALALLTSSASRSEFEPRLETADVPEALGILAQYLVGDPSATLPVIGITGTNGKTTTSSLVEQALAVLGRRPARLGTLGLYVDRTFVRDTLTTPSAEDLADCLRTAKERGASELVMEVSSHALDQKRTAGVRFAVTAFSNLSQDHLDYHGDMDRYGAAKARLFEGESAQAVINVQDPFGARLAARLPRVLSVALDPAWGAQLSVGERTLSRMGITLEVLFQGQRASIESPLVGEFNAHNLLLACGILLALGIPLASAALSLSRTGSVPGRLERCDGPGDDLVALVDYAHTPDAVERVLAAAAELGASRVVCVLGCGGDRDRKKRPLMGRAAAEGADEVWVTSDNPRSEDPAAIARDVLSGTAGGRAKIVTEIDRKRAIFGAISGAPPGSVVLVLGKGHETYQLIGSEVLDFDDRVEVRSALAGRRGSRSP